MNWKSSWKLVTPVLAGILIFNTIGVDSTTAYFEDVEEFERSILSANIDLKADSTQGITLNLTNFVPGDFYKETVTLTNDGNVPIKVLFDVNTTDVTNLLFTNSEGLKVEIAQQGGGFNLAPTVLANVDSSEVSAELGVGESVTLDVTIKLDLSTSNIALMAKSLDFSLDFTGQSLPGEDRTPTP